MIQTHIIKNNYAIVNTNIQIIIPFCIEYVDLNINGNGNLPNLHLKVIKTTSVSGIKKFCHLHVCAVKEHMISSSM